MVRAVLVSRFHSSSGEGMLGNAVEFQQKSTVPVSVLEKRFWQFQFCSCGNQSTTERESVVEFGIASQIEDADSVSQELDEESFGLSVSHWAL